LPEIVSEKVKFLVDLRGQELDDILYMQIFPPG
jgi:hypothetical protein